MDAAQIITALMGVGGGGVLLGQIFQWVRKRVDGTANRERIRNTDLVMQRVKAVEAEEAANERAAEADKNRRLALDQVSRYRRILIENGIDPGEEIEIGRSARKRPRQIDAAE